VPPAAWCAVICAESDIWPLVSAVWAPPAPDLGSEGLLFCGIPGVLYSDFMQTILRATEFLCLGLWLGSDAFLSFVVAPGAFMILGNRDAAGLLVGYSLARLHFTGIFLGALFLLARLIRTRDFASFTTVAALCVVLMVALTAASQFTVSSKMEDLKTEMVSLQNTPETDPRRLEFNRWHRISVACEGAVLLLGFAAMVLLVRESLPKPR